MYKEGIKILSQKTLEKYKSEGYTADVVKQIKEELNSVLSVIKEDFPIEFENEIGKWRIESNGVCFIQPRMNIQYIECNFIISPTGETQYDE
jgi:hypothetical protein